MNIRTLEIIRAIAMAIGVVVLVWAAVGCKSSKVTGGSARHDTGGFTATYYPPGGGWATVVDHREAVATTQPSYSSTTDKAQFASNDAPVGTLGGFKLKTENFKQSQTAWGLVGILALLAVAFYLIGKPVYALLCVGGIVIAFIAPQILVWVVLVCVAIFAYANRSYFMQFVKGNQRAIAALPPQQAEVVKTNMAADQGPDLQKLVKAVKAKLPKMEPRAVTVAVTEPGPPE